MGESFVLFQMMRAALVLVLFSCVAALAEEAQPTQQVLEATLDTVARMADFPTSTFLQVDFSQGPQEGAQTQGTLPGGLAPQGMHDFPMQWNPYLATMQHPFQLGNQMMSNGMGGFPFPYNGYYPYFNPHPFLQTPHTPPSPLGDPL